MSLLHKQQELTIQNQTLLLSVQSQTQENEDLKKEISNDIAISRKDIEELRLLLKEKESQAIELLKEKKNGEEKLRDAKIVIEQIRKDMNALNEELAEKDENIANLHKNLDDSQLRERSSAL
jgi:chromosome segregation ATPase